jgi:A/G-specific adenine glycosylase
MRSALLAWYLKHRRDLPWRKSRDPYRVWISEVMLQQTRVETVVPYYDRFLARWPTVEALAAADPAEVQAAWSGLGYYRRARLMLEAAAEMVHVFGGAVPGDFTALLGLPGFGRYTAGAVASIAFGLEKPAVDGNVQRVLARIFGIEGDVSTGEPNAAVWAKAETLAKGEAPGDLNQALIELGATVCSPRAPKCMLCPVQKACVARATSRVDTIPPPRKRATRSSIERTALLVLDGSRVILEKQPSDGLFADLWCLPMLDGRLEADQVSDEAERKYRWRLDRIEDAGDVKHVLTHRDIMMRIVRVSLHARRSNIEPPLRKVDLHDLATLGVPSMTTRALSASLPPALLSAIVLPGRRSRARRGGA